MSITVERLNTKWIARPAGQLGTCGWYPFPWTIAYGSTAEKAKITFIKQHKKHL